MKINRRLFLAGCATSSIAACGGTASPLDPVIPTGLPADLRPAANADFAHWLVSFRPRARRAGISSATLDLALSSAGYLPGVVTRDGTQIHTRRTLEEYLSIATSDERLAKGRTAFARQADLLAAIEAQYGVDARIVTAIWGMESQFGERRGQIPVISSTATLAFHGRRADFYENQLIAALRILDHGDTTAQNLTGSWAGAMGHTQFIPTSYQAFAVDFTGDGRRDIWGDNPADALASTASYLARNGWHSGLRWGAETGTGGPAGRIIQPQNGGVRFTVTRNFNVIKTYNNSDFYAVAVGHLADRIGGAGPLLGSFPADENGLSRNDRLAIQRGLVAYGYDIGTIDGVIGAKTEAAIRDFEQSRGRAVTGIASAELLAILR
ncbi:MAG: lytic murein transglycosylase [Rhodobacteraceae bacterium]|nr:lytic murein transglycosylase [Paracoccaceae bacterium]PHR55403.1 MAG: peptidoglycan-binding protein [Robiginitomaculum sp.]